MNKTVHSNGMSSILLYQHSTERVRAVHVAARKLAHFLQKVYSSFAYGSVICSAHTGRSDFSDFFYTRDPVENSIKCFRPGFSAFTKCGNTGIGAFLFLREYVIYFIYV